MDKKIKIPIIFAIVLVAGFLFIKTNTNDSMMVEDESPSDTVMMEDTSKEDAMMEDDTSEKTMMSIPEGALEFRLVDPSTASYLVQKRFLSKADQEVIGTTTNVTGGGWVDVENQKFYLKGTIGLDALKSDNFTDVRLPIFFKEIPVIFYLGTYILANFISQSIYINVVII